MLDWNRAAALGLALTVAAATAAGQAPQRLEAGAPARIVADAPADTYVEARVRPLAGTGRVYVVGRYEDERNWIGAGLHYQAGTGRMQVELVRMRGGELARLKQFGRAAPGDGRWQTVRLEMAGHALAVYLNGERITNATDPQPPRAGRYGVAAFDASFEASLPVTGDPAVKPARLALARAPQRVQLSVGDAPLRLPVSALGPYRYVPAADAVPQPPGGPNFIAAGRTLDPATLGARPFRFVAQAGDPALLKVETDEDHVTLAPLAPGSTTVTLTSADDANVATVIDVQVGAAHPARDIAYPLSGAVLPRPGARDVPWDTPLRLRFDAPPVPGTSGGAIRIHRKRDGALVDTIRAEGEYDLLGHRGQAQRRALRLRPIALEGRNAIVHPHSDRLQPGEEYVVTIDDGVLTGTLGGRPFGGIAARHGWTFRTRATAPRGTTFVVDDDGPADFRTVQGALNYTMAHVARATPVLLAIRNGRYQEQLYLRGKDNVTLRGESRDGVVIDAVNNDALNPGSGTSQDARSPGIAGGRAVFLIEDADLVTLDTLTIRNSTLRPNGGQAEALFFNSEGRLVAKNASFFSEQDTVQVRGYAWFWRTLVAGNVDFIWGNNRAALFEESELRTVGDSGRPDSGGYLLQARTVAPGDKGFMFVNSRLTHGPGPKGNDVPPGATFLARSSGYDFVSDHIAFIDCRMGPHIAAAGWAGPNARQPAPNPAQAGPAAGWREYGTRDLQGRPLDLSGRVHGRVLSADEARAAYGGRAAFFADFDGGRGWNPQP
jgi:pectin methylesterase-like acyl-CoA thioesterase